MVVALWVAHDRSLQNGTISLCAMHSNEKLDLPISVYLSISSDFKSTSRLDILELLSLLANVTDSSGTTLYNYTGTADEVGQASFLFVIPVDAATDVYSVNVQAFADGYENASASTTFDVIGSGGFLLITAPLIISPTIAHQAMAVLQATIVAYLK